MVSLLSSTSLLCSAVEDAVDGCEADVLVAAPVAGEEVGVQHLVVVSVGRAVVGDQVACIDHAVAIDVLVIGSNVYGVDPAIPVDVLDVQIGNLLNLRRGRIAVIIEQHWRCMMRDVVQEGMAGADGGHLIGESGRRSKELGKQSQMRKIETAGDALQ